MPPVDEEADEEEIDEEDADEEVDDPEDVTDDHVALDDAEDVELPAEPPELASV
jgi:hypothetical protein